MAKQAATTSAQGSLRWLDATSLSLCAGLQIYTWYRLFQKQQLQLPDLLSALIVAWLIADLASGIAHFLADHCGSATTPFFGRAFIEPFREHHRDPLALLQHGFLERNGNNALIASSILLWIPLHPLASAASAWWASMLACLSLWSAFTNQIHAWAHASDVPPLVRFLQRYGILLSPAHHARHHAPYEMQQKARNQSEQATTTPGTFAESQLVSSAYCITSGVCDKLLGALTRRAMKAKTSPSLEHRASVRHDT